MKINTKLKENRKSRSLQIHVQQTLLEGNENIFFLLYRKILKNLLYSQAQY